MIPDSAFVNCKFFGALRSRLCGFERSISVSIPRMEEDGLGGLRRPSPRSSQGEASRQALAALVAAASTAPPRGASLPSVAVAAGGLPAPDFSGPGDVRERGGESPHEVLSLKVRGPSGASSALGLVDGGVSRVLELEGGGRDAGGVSFDGSRRPSDGLFPAFVGGG